MSLTELLCVIVIISILAAMYLGSIARAFVRIKNSSRAFDRPFTVFVPFSPIASLRKLPSSNSWRSLTHLFCQFLPIVFLNFGFVSGFGFRI